MIPFKLTATSVNNGVPGGYRVLLANELDHAWLTVLAKETEERLTTTPEGHAVKVRLFSRLRRESTANYEWLAKRLNMGSRSYASNLVYAGQKKHK